MRRFDKLPRTLLLAALLALVTGCLSPPVREILRIEVKPGGEALVTTETRIAEEDDFDQSPRAQRRIEDARRDLEDQADAWSRRLVRLEPAWDERTVERREGRIVRVTRRSLLEPLSRLETLFADTDVDCALRAGEGWQELEFLPGVSRRATARQRALYERVEEHWIEAASRYLEAMSALYDHLEGRPWRAEACLAPLVADVVREEDLEGLPELSRVEAALVKEASDAADELQVLFLVPEDAAYTIDELSSLVHDPFPAPIDLRVPGEILDFEGFEASEGEFRLRGPSLWNAWRAIGGEALAPDPVLERWERGRAVGEARLALGEFAGRPRRALALSARELQARLGERLEVAPVYRVRWAREPASQE